MNDFMLDMALRHFEFNDQQIAQIKGAIPKIAYLAHLVKTNKTVINQMIDVIDMVTAQINKQEPQ